MIDLRGNKPEVISRELSNSHRGIKVATSPRASEERMREPGRYDRSQTRKLLNVLTYRK